MSSSTPSPTNGGSHHFSLATSIAAAECASSAASLGCVWMIGRQPQLIAPVKDYVAEHVIFPIMSRHLPKEIPAEEKDNIMRKAQQNASLLLKGVIMVSASLASHIPIQMALEGKHDLKEFKKVILGKSLGISAAMGSLALINHIKPGAVAQVEDSIANRFFHCDTSKSKEHCEADKELCKLMVIDIPSSVMAGLVNYQIAKRF